MYMVKIKLCVTEIADLRCIFDRVVSRPLTYLLTQCLLSGGLFTFEGKQRFVFTCIRNEKVFKRDVYLYLYLYSDGLSRQSL